MRAVIIVLCVLAGVARAQPDETSPGFAVAVDAHLAFGDLVHSNLGVRGELILARSHALVARAGVGKVEWLDTEYDDPTYREWLGRLGYRLTAEHVYAGVELGRSTYQAHFPAVDNMPAHTGRWFGETTVTALVGCKLGPVDLGLDYTKAGSTSIGLFIGVGYRRR